MNTAQHISPEDLALVALQFLPDAELNDAMLHLEHCDQCRTELAAIQGDLAVYAMTSEMHSPPAQARERLMRRVAKEKKVVPIERPLPVAAPAIAAPIAEVPLQSRATPIAARAESTDDDELVLPSRDRNTFAAGAATGTLFSHSFGSQNAASESYDEAPRRGSKVTSIAAWTGWAIAAGIAAVAFMQFHQRQGLQSDLTSANARIAESAAADSRAQQVLSTLTAENDLKLTMHVPTPEGVPQSRLPEGHAAYDQARGALIFTATNLLPVPPEKTYELWVLPNDGKAAPIPAGIFHPDQSGSATVVLPEIPKGIDAKGFGVTLEDAGGTKTPTMSQLVLVGM